MCFFVPWFQTFFHFLFDFGIFHAPQSSAIAGGRIRTAEGTKPQDLLSFFVAQKSWKRFFPGLFLLSDKKKLLNFFSQVFWHLPKKLLKSCPFDRSGTPAAKQLCPRICFKAL